MQPFSYSSSTALVTGASRGIGAALAHALARRGIQTLILTARVEGDLENLAADLFDAYGTRVETIPADLASPDGPTRLQEQIERRGLSVDLLINNAGFGTHGLFQTADPKKTRAMIEVNIGSLVALTRLFLPGMVAKGRGGVVNIASTAAFIPVPFMSVYAATKSFVLSFSEGLAVEMTDQGADDVRVIALCPGRTESHFADDMGPRRFEGTTAHSAERVATETLDALDRNDTVAIVGRKNTAMVEGFRLLPRKAMARMSGDLFRPADLPAPSRTASPRTRVLIAAITAGAAGVVAAAILMRRTSR